MSEAALALCVKNKGEQLFNVWNLIDCPNTFSSILNTVNTDMVGYNPQRLPVLQDAVVELFNSYNTTNSITNNKNSAAYNPFQEKLLDLCIDPTLPGICSKYLEGYCGSFTREQVIANPTLINFCGCYTPPDENYMKYTLANGACLVGDPDCKSGCTAGSPDCFPQPACDPLCHRAMTSQKANPANGNFINCPQNICVIDNVVINTVNTQTPGGVNFFNMCGGCNETSGCLCIISGVSVSQTGGNIGIGSNINQVCSGSSICMELDENGKVVSEGACGTNIANDMEPPSIYYGPNLFILGMMILFALIALFLSLISRYNNYVIF